MHRILIFVFAASAIAGPGTRPPVRANRTLAVPAPALLQPAAVNISNLFATPLTLNLSDPDAAPATATGSVQWTITGGDPSASFPVSVSSDTTFTGCPEIPVNAITLTCNSLQGPRTGVCSSSPVALTDTPQQIAISDQKPGKGNYTLNVTVTITDAWRYKGHTAPSCNLNLIYTISAN